MHKEIINKLVERNPDTNKYDYGHVLIVGGAPGMVGAPLLSAMAALRLGAGLVTIASSENVIDKLEKRVLEVMTLRIPLEENAAVSSLLDFIKNRKVNVVVFGPGMNPDFGPIVKNIMSKLQIPVVLDASAITCYKGNLDLLKAQAINNQNIVLTPHDGEFEKLTNITLSKIGDERKKVVDDFAKQNNLVLVSKGDHTLVANPNSEIYENQSGNPGLATPGSGDVLAGIIAALIVQDVNPKDASELGVYVHGVAGDIAAKEKTQAGMIASDIIEYLPHAIKMLSK